MSPRKLATPFRSSLLVSVAIAAAYLAIAPPSTDLAAQTFRAELFSERGFVLWSEDWYAGFHVLGYSVIFPPLAALLGVRLAGAIAAIAAAALFAMLARRRFGDAAPLAAVWFAAGAAAWLFTGRLTFLLGVAIGLAALLATDARRLVLAAILAALCALASPVTGAFLAVAGAAAAIAGARREGVALLAPAAGATLLLGLAFPTLGEAPFAFSSFVAVPVFAVLALVLIPREQRALRIGVLLYAVLVLGSFALPNPLGGNAVRLGALFAGPLAALVLWPRPWLLAAVALPLLYWQLEPPVADVVKASGDPATEAAYYAPLLSELERRGVGADELERVHVPPTETRYEAVHVAERHPLARGWLRQLESEDFGLFGEGNLTADAYADWLAERAVAYVAVPDAELDWLARDEVALIESGLPFLRPLWAGERWRLYRVALGADPVAERLERVAPGRFALRAPPGEYLLPLRWTPYRSLEGAEACAADDDGWTRVELAANRGDGVERLELSTALSLGGLLGRERVCSR